MDTHRKARLREQIAGTQTQEVLDQLEQESRIDASDPDLWFFMGLANHRLGRFEAAQSRFLRSATLDAPNATTAYYIGLSAERQSHMQDAIAAYKAAHSIDPAMVEPQKKLQLLVPGWTPTQPPQPKPEERTPPPSATTTSSAPKRPPQRQSRLGLPETEEDLQDFAEKYRRVAEIEAEAQLAANVKAAPTWFKRLFVGCAVFIGVAFVAFVVVVIFALTGAFGFVQEWCSALHDDFGVEAGAPFCS